MNINAIATDSAITVRWTGTEDPVDLYRTGDGGQTWELLAEGTDAGLFIDNTAEPGPVYLYYAKQGAVRVYSNPVWILPRWGWNAVTQAFTANDLVNRPTLRARVLDSASKKILQPDAVRAVTLTVWSVFENDVTEYPRWYRLSSPEEIDPASVLSPNLIADPYWRDNDGYNFSHTPEIDLDPGDYAFRYALETDGGTIYLHFRYTSLKRRA